MWGLRRVLRGANLTAWHGRVCLGALNGTTAKWLAPASAERQDMSFTMDESGAFMVLAL